MMRIAPALLQAAQRLLRTPGFTAVVVGLIALAVAALLTLGTAASALLWRPLPFPAGERLVRVQGFASQMQSSIGFAPGLLTDLGAMPEVEALGNYDYAPPLFDGDGHAFANARIEPGLVELLGGAPLLGRLPVEDDGDAVAVLSEPLWRARFGADPSIIGRDLDFDGTRLRVVGVMSGAFRFPERSTALWRPLRLGAEQMHGPEAFGFGAVQTLVRLAPGVTVEHLDEAVRTRLGAREELAPMREFLGLRLQVRALRDDWNRGRDSVVALLALAAGAVLSLLLANVASLWLSRCLQRARELALRSALGASPQRIASDLIAEVLVVAAVAVGLALLAVVPGLRALEALGVLDPGSPLLPAIDAGTLLAAFGVFAALVAALSLVPVWIARRPQALALLALGTRAAGGTRGAQRARRALVALQIGLAVSLLCGAGLLVRSLQQLLNQDPGFTPARLSLVLVQDRDAGSGGASLRARLQALQQDLAQVPGVEAMTWSNAPPFSFSESVASVAIEERSGGGAVNVHDRRVGPGYFGTLQVALSRGRDFVRDDANPAAPGVIVDERFARLHFGDADPLGKRLRVGEAEVDGAPAWAQVVGVARTVRHLRLDESPDLGTVYRYATDPAPEAGNIAFVLRSSLPLSELAQRTRAAANAQGLRAGDVVSVTARMHETFAQRVPTLGLLSAFALAGALLAALGLFALVAVDVQRRTTEYGVRLALGAPPSSLSALALREGLRAALPGLALGALGAFAAGRLLAAKLYQVSPWDPFTLASVLLAALGLVLLACLGPARRAASLDPMTTLRHE
jgi:putative ABC transport system permease protein